MKKQAIKQAWINTIGSGDFVRIEKKINENGWCRENVLNKLNLDDDLFEKIDSGVLRPLFYLRPICLEGIEDNSGWVRIETMKDLPKTQVRCVLGLMRDDGTFSYGREEVRSPAWLLYRWQTRLITHYKIKILEKSPNY